MTTPTIARSAYPPAVAELLPQARALVAELGHVPSQNRIKTELKVGTDKARELRGALLTPDEPAPSDPVPAEPTPDAPAAPEAAPVDAPPLVARVVEPVTPDAAPDAAEGISTPEATEARPHAVRSWPVLLLALPAFVAIWSGWVGLGGLTGFGVVHPLPGIWEHFSLNSAITLPIGVETYAAFALRAWLSGAVPPRARRFARASAIGSLLLGALGQVAYHLMTAAHVAAAPWEITTLVASLPVAVLGMGAALAHLMREPHQ